MDNDITFSITAFIDLLGFSSHLHLASNDLRTAIGQQALKRLEFLEEAIEVFEKERKEYPAIYPKKLHYQRINDALILGIDTKNFIPIVGQVDVPSGYTIAQIRAIRNRNEKYGTVENDFSIEANNVALFLGLVARLHLFISEKEREVHLPGCRTVVSTGMRYKFLDRKKKEDYYSANFSFTNAFLVNEKGSKIGITGNQMYVDDNISRILRRNNHCHSILGYAQYIEVYESINPYIKRQEVIQLGRRQFMLSKKINVDLFGKTYAYRSLNLKTLTNLQFTNYYKKIVYEKSRYAKEAFTELIKKAFTEKTATLEEINSEDGIISSFDFPFLSLVMRLTDRADDTFDIEPE
jgi:hypothetical protein